MIDRDPPTPAEEASGAWPAARAAVRREVLHPLLFVLVGRSHAIPRMMWMLFVVASGLLALEHSAALEGLTGRP